MLLVKWWLRVTQSLMMRRFFLCQTPILICVDLTMADSRSAMVKSTLSAMVRSTQIRIGVLQRKNLLTWGDLLPSSPPLLPKQLCSWSQSICTNVVCFTHRNSEHMHQCCHSVHSYHNPGRRRWGCHNGRLGNQKSPRLVCLRQLALLRNDTHVKSLIYYRSNISAAFPFSIINNC